MSTTPSIDEYQQGGYPSKSCIKTLNLRNCFGMYKVNPFSKTGVKPAIAGIPRTKPYAYAPQFRPNIGAEAAQPTRTPEMRKLAVLVARQLKTKKTGLVVASADSTNDLAKMVAHATGARVRMFAFESSAPAKSGMKYSPEFGYKAILDTSLQKPIEDQVSQIRQIYKTAKEEQVGLDIFITHAAAALAASKLKFLRVDYAAIYDAHRLAEFDATKHSLYNGDIRVSKRLSFTDEPRYRNIDKKDRTGIIRLQGLGEVMYPIGMGESSKGQEPPRIRIIPAKEFARRHKIEDRLEVIQGITCFRINNDRGFKVPGIYLIQDTDNPEMVYIGSTREMERRKRSHKKTNVNSKMASVLKESAAFFCVEVIEFSENCGCNERGDALCCRENHWIAEILKKAAPDEFARGHLAFSKILNCHYATPNKADLAGGDWVGFLESVFEQNTKLEGIYTRIGWKIPESGFPAGYLNMPRPLNPTHYNMLQNIENGKIVITDDVVREYLQTIPDEDRRNRFGGNDTEGFVSETAIEHAKDIILGRCKMQKLTDEEKRIVGARRKCSFEGWISTYERIAKMYKTLCEDAGLPPTTRFLPGSIRIPYDAENLPHYKMVRSVENGIGSPPEATKPMFEQCGIYKLTPSEKQEAYQRRQDQRAEVDTRPPKSRIPAEQITPESQLSRRTKTPDAPAIKASRPMGAV